MAVERVLSQEEIDSVFRNLREQGGEDDPAKRAQPYDFRRPDRIAKDQLRSIHLLHESFARSLSSSLSAYLRNYALVNLVSVEQLSFMEFSQCLPSPTCLITLSMRPYDGNAVLEINPPRTPAAKVPPRSPKSLCATYPVRPSPATKTTIHQASRGLTTP